MSDDDAKNKIYGICNSLNAIGGYFMYNDKKGYGELLLKAQVLIEDGMKQIESEEK